MLLRMKRVILKHQSKITITTEIGEHSFADTEIFLYDDLKNLIARDDNGNRNKFSKITVSNINKGWYYIKVIRKKVFFLVFEC